MDQMRIGRVRSLFLDLMGRRSLFYSNFTGLSPTTIDSTALNSDSSMIAKPHEIGVTHLPDHTELPESDGTFVKNFQEHPQSILRASNESSAH
jgi:hypothetical protein